MEKRLWDVKHPYYCEPATYFQNSHNVYTDAQEFLELFGGNDRDMNYVVRWDWNCHTEDGEKTSNDGVFFVFCVIQRKGFFWSGEFPVTEKDEPALRAWLEDRWKTVQENWKPIST